MILLGASNASILQVKTLRNADYLEGLGEVLNQYYHEIHETTSPCEYFWIMFRQL